MRAERRPNLRASLVKATLILAEKKLSMGQSAEKVARDIRAAMAQSLEGEAAWAKTFDVGRGPEPFLSTAGVFRSILAEHEVDRSDQRVQERWFAVVDEALNDMLSARED